MEYVGEVFNAKMMRRRAREYHREGIKHIYFMQLQSNLRIDATRKGNVSRFLNHSCNPNAKIQKWTVNGELRIGFFTIRNIRKGDEVTIDYQFTGRSSQKCLCGSQNCRGSLVQPLKNEDDESDNENDESDSSSSDDEYYAKSTVLPTKAKLKIKKITFKKPYPSEVSDSKQVETLIKTGIKNKSQTISLSRLILRTQDIDLRLSLLNILKSADLPCRLAFLDYNGLRLLHNWMCDKTDENSIQNLRLYVELLNTFDLLPITNTLLRKSNLLDEVEQLARKLDSKLINCNNGELFFYFNSVNFYKLYFHLLVETTPYDVLEELPTLKILINERSNELLQKWKGLKEDFKIPTLKQREEAIPTDVMEPVEDVWDDSIAISSSCQNSSSSVRYKKEVSRNYYTPPSSTSTFLPSSSSTFPSQSASSNTFLKHPTLKETENFMKLEHKKNCDIFNLPETTNPLHVPCRVNRATDEYFNLYGSRVNQPPNHNLLKTLYKPLPYNLSTNPEDYDLQPMNLPKHWKSGIDKRGRIFYFHGKHRKSQWEPPVKNETSPSDESSTDTEDSEEELLNEQLIYLKKKQEKKKIQPKQSKRKKEMKIDSLKLLKPADTKMFKKV